MGTLNRRGFIQASAAAALAAPFVRPAAAQTGKTIVFGGSVPISGRAAETGLNVQNGYLTAVKYINEVLGGVEIGGEKHKVELRLFDDASDPARATTLIQRLLDDKVDFFLGSFGSNIVLPTAAITERAERPMVQAGGGSDQIFTQGYKYMFGMFPRASRQFISSAAFFKTIQPLPKTISVIMTNDAFSKTNAEGAIKDCKAAGIELKKSYTLPENITDASSVLASIRSETPDILICTTHDQDSLLISRQMATSNTNVSLLYQTLGPQLATYRETLGKYANGIAVQMYWDERAHYSDPFFETTPKFVEYYKKNNTRPIAYHCAGAAACIVTYLKAMQNAKSVKPGEVRDALAAIELETVYAKVKFTTDGDGDPLLLGPAIGQVQKGQVEIVYPEGAKTGALAYPSPKWSEKA